MRTIDPHTPGAKLDDGKIRAGLMVRDFAHALEAVAEVSTFGAAKYSPSGWLHVPDGHARYTDALYRHLLAQARGDDRDFDSGLRHAAHAAWNALALLELELREKAKGGQ